MDWWQRILPIQSDEPLVGIAYQHAAHSFQPARRAIADDGDAVMLVRPRLSRIFYRRRFFDYPVKLNGNTVQNLGFPRMARIGLSYAAARVAPQGARDFPRGLPRQSLRSRALHDLLPGLHRKGLGGPLHGDFGGMGCAANQGTVDHESPHSRAPARGASRHLRVAQREVETSLIERFLYPKFGPGQLWETVAERVKARGARIMLEHRVVQLRHAGGRVVSADVRDERTGLVTTFPVR